jgi:hypothetical protein
MICSSVNLEPYVVRPSSVGGLSPILEEFSGLRSHGFADERSESIRCYVRNYTRDDVPLAADRADDWRFAGANAAGS